MVIPDVLWVISTRQRDVGAPLPREGRWRCCGTCNTMGTAEWGGITPKRAVGPLRLGRKQ